MDRRRDLDGRAEPLAPRAADAARRWTDVPAQRSPVEEQSMLITAAQDGDEWAFRQLYRTFQPGLLLYLRGLVGDEAEDVASETWGQIARDLASFTGDGPAFRAWSATIARHRGLDHLRRLRRRPVTADSGDAELSSWVAADDTEASVIEAAATGAAMELIASLPPDQAEAVLLRVVLGLDAQTTATVLGKRPGAVRSAAHRGLRRLAAMLGDRDEPAAAVRPRTRIHRMASMSNGNGGEHASTNDMDQYGPSIDAETAQRMLDGEVVGPPRLASLLALVAYRRRDPAPAGPLRGEERAVAAFRAARAAAARSPHHATRRRNWSRALALKVAVVAFVLSGGGVAVAAATGVIPSPLPLRAPAPRSAAPQPAIRPDTAAAPRVTSSGPDSDRSRASVSPSAAPKDLNGLCRAWAGDFGQDPAVAEHNPRYADLIAVAGGVDHVTAFCQAYLASRTPGNGKADPTTSKGGH